MIAKFASALSAMGAALLLGACSSGSGYRCPDETGGIMSFDVCSTWKQYEYREQTLQDASTGKTVLLENYTAGRPSSEPLTLSTHLEPEVPGYACNASLAVTFPAAPVKGQRVQAIGVRPGWYYYVRESGGLDTTACPTVTPATWSGWIEMVSDNTVADEEGPKHGRETIYTFEAKWDSKTLKGELVYTSKTTHP